ncbi:hypothetical protein TNIN_392541 [Trichonephila inaurata madagascariensis]|uniref:Uncharacterized protein n=1 Tax=Trichonephila inaurata madagascariensis TaxID=2747483 RepID=A0A8X6J6H2_9ARAC|nr:hypothetical protein TNIN_392541 [Trichonephila inaurata madagascariensis]
MCKGRDSMWVPAEHIQHSSPRHSNTLRLRIKSKSSEFGIDYLIHVTRRVDDQSKRREPPSLTAELHLASEALRSKGSSRAETPEEALDECHHGRVASMDEKAKD